MVADALATPWYWLYRIGRSLSISSGNFNYLCLINVEEWHKMQIYVYVFLFSLKKIARKGLRHDSAGRYGQRMTHPDWDLRLVVMLCHHFALQEHPTLRLYLSPSTSYCRNSSIMCICFVYLYMVAVSFLFSFAFLISYYHILFHLWIAVFKQDMFY